MSGCEAAITAAHKGHRVTLLEKSGQLGGQWIPASMPVGKSEFTSLLLWQKAMLEKLHVQVLLNTQADRELIRLYEPDAVVVATGSKPFVPGFLKGADQDFVVNAHATCSWARWRSRARSWWWAAAWWAPKPPTP